jgi:hypothetical protein
MNLFVLDANPRLSAEMHHDVHVNKMATEACQILTAACAVLLKSYDEVPAAKRGTTKKVWRRPFADGWGVSHPYHPSTVWTAASYGNAVWALSLGLALCYEWAFRFDKNHRTLGELYRMGKRLVDLRPLFPLQEQQPFTIAFDRETYRHCLRDDPIESYRAYYVAAKLVLPTKGRAVWTRRNEPAWLQDYEVPCAISSSSPSSSSSRLPSSISW